MSRVIEPVASSDEWVSGRQARLILGKAQSALLRLVVLGKIRVVNEPGIPTRYHKADVERLAESRSQAATVGA